MPESSTTQDKPNAVVEIERLGFGWTLESQYDLTRLSVDRRVQVRELKHYSPKESVQRFAIQMISTPFPPIVVTRDGWIVDGNTRVGAKLLQKQDHFFPAIVLAVEWDTASPKVRNELYALAATLNSDSGVGLTAREIRDVTPRMIELGWKVEQIGRAIGLKASSVSQVKREVDAKKRLDKIGLELNGEAKGPSLRALGTKEVLGLTDAPFRELAQLSADAGLNASEITSAAKSARETGTETGALEKLAALRVECGDRIRQKALTGKGVPPMSRQLRQHLGFVAKFAGREQELVETDPAVGQTHLEALRVALAVLGEVLRMQEL
jgi:hypothetical protein